MQRKYESKGLKVVGVATLDSLENVEEYVANMGERMAYTIAYDEDKKLWKRWMQAAGKSGIPNSFIVDRKGDVVWIGHPLGIEFVLDQILAGTFDPKAHAALVDELDALYEAIKDKDADDARQHVDAIARLEPNPATTWVSRVRVESEFGNEATVRDVLKKGLARLQPHPHQLAAFADYSFVIRGYAKNHADLALPILAAAWEKSPEVTELGLTYCCVLAKSGKLESAQAAGERHLARVTDDDIALYRMAVALGEQDAHDDSVTLALKAIDRAIELRPGESDYLKTKLTILVSVRDDVEAAKKTGAAYLETLRRPSEYNNFAWWLLTEEDAKGKFAELALAAAERMHAEDGNNMNYIDTLALARFENGFVDKAIELQAQAVKLCRNAASRKSFTERLERYKAAKR